jgi:hypothetical protein
LDGRRPIVPLLSAILLYDPVLGRAFKAEGVLNDEQPGPNRLAEALAAANAIATMGTNSGETKSHERSTKNSSMVFARGLFGCEFVR